MLENYLYSRYDTPGYNSRDLSLVASIISNKTMSILFSLKSKGSNGELEDKNDRTELQDDRLHTVTLFGIIVAHRRKEKFNGFRSGYYGLFSAIGEGL